jgi:hypothetical protein
MNKLDKLVEDKIRAKGWIKLLPTEKCETSQPHRFRYTDGQTTSVCIIQDGALVGVYQGPSWKEKYKQVDWDTPECNCKDCLLNQGLEQLERTGKAAAVFARQLEGADPDKEVRILGLQVEDVIKDSYKQVTFYYKIDE